MPALAVGMLISTQLATCPFHQRWGKWLFLVEWNQFHGYLRCPGSYRTTRIPPMTLVELMSEYLDYYLEFDPHLLGPSLKVPSHPAPCLLQFQLIRSETLSPMQPLQQSRIGAPMSAERRKVQVQPASELLPNRITWFSSWLVVPSPRAHQGHHWIALRCTAPLLEARPVTLWSSGVLFFSSQNKNHIDSFPEKVSPEKARKTYIAAHLHVFSVFRDEGRNTRSFGKYKGHV